LEETGGGRRTRILELRGPGVLGELVLRMLRNTTGKWFIECVDTLSIIFERMIGAPSRPRSTGVAVIYTPCPLLGAGLCLNRWRRGLKKSRVDGERRNDLRGNNLLFLKRGSDLRQLVLKEVRS